MNFLNIFHKSKARVTYLVLLLGLIFSLIININFISERAVSSLTQLQENYTNLQAKSTFNNIEQFVENRVKLLTELSQSPIVISSVMGVDLASANLIDLLDERMILGSKEKIYLSDFTGELIYPNHLVHFLTPDWFENILNEQNPVVVTIIEESHQHYFRIAKPVKYQGHVEGIVMIDIVSVSIEQLLEELLKSHNYAVKFDSLNGSSFQTTELNGYALVTDFILGETPMKMSFYLSTAATEHEKSEYIWQIGSTLTLTTVGAFLLLAFLIRSFLINPLEKLSLSEQKIKQSEQRFQLAVLGSNDGIWDWNISDQAVYFSQKFMKMTGLTSNEEKQSLNKQALFFDYMHPDDVLNVKRAIIEHLRDNKPFDCEVRLQVGGEYRYFRARGLALRGANGKAIRMSGALTDITDTREQSLALEEALKDAKKANAAKSDFLANMSHEIRTPMNGVLGTFQILKRQKLSNSANELIDTGIISSKALLCIINDILDLSKIESNNITLESIPTNIVELFEIVISELSILAEQKNTELVFDFSNGFHECWLADPIRLRQVIMNLVSNAIKFTDEGRVEVIISECENGIIFNVNDTGIGLSQQQIKNLFNRFEQADSSISRNYGGTGLGLAISKHLVHLMGGEIKVSSELNVGTTFSVILPFNKTTNSHDDIQSKAVLETPDASSLNILLAEDNKINQKIFVATLEPTNATIQIANDGVEAIKAVDSQMPDLIFMDIQMPNMDGLSACIAIRKRYPTLPIYALTANVMSQDIDKYKLAGFDDCLGKPIDITDIYQLLIKHSQTLNA